MIDPALIEEIIRAWNNDQEQPGRCRVRRDIYSVEMVKPFVQEVFFASMVREEERRLSFSAVLASPQQATVGIKYKCEIQRLNTPVPFIVSSIAKIVPAIHPNLSSLAVTQGEKGNLVIWGIFSYEPTPHLYNEVPIKVEYGQYLRPDFLTVSAVAPGSLIFSRQNAMIGRLVNGHFVSASPTAFSSLSLGRYLLPLVKPPFDWPHWSAGIKVLLEESAQRGHGGTIAMIDSAEEPVPGLIMPKYDLSDNMRLGKE